MKSWTALRLPALSLLAMWLLLTQSVTAAQILLGVVVTGVALRAASALRVEPASFARLRPALKLAGVVLLDILRSNLAVAVLVLFPRQERIAGFVRLPLELTSRPGLAVLALIITATPGTIWVEFDRRSSSLLVHVLDLIDEDAWIRLIKVRYESLLLEIFRQ